MTSTDDETREYLRKSGVAEDQLDRGVAMVNQFLEGPRPLPQVITNSDGEEVKAVLTGYSAYLRPSLSTMEIGWINYEGTERAVMYLSEREAREIRDHLTTWLAGR